jgi:hypothetical protein
MSNQRSVEWPCWYNNLAVEISRPRPISLLFLEAYKIYDLENYKTEENEVVHLIMNVSYIREQTA